eukprot:5698928-Lingulodinium_polyedra.AAC.1
MRRQFVRGRWRPFLERASFLHNARVLVECVMRAQSAALLCPDIPVCAAKGFDRECANRTFAQESRIMARAA